MDESSPILVREQNGILRMAWDNRRVRKNNFVLWVFVIFWAIWAPVTLVMTCAIFLPGADESFRVFAAIWCIFGWLGTLGIPLSIVRRTWSEWIEISPEAISYGCIGFLARKPKTFPMDTIIELGCGHYGGQEPESMMTLNMIRSGGIFGSRRRHIFGYWLASELVVQVFETIEQFVTRSEIPLKMTRYSPIYGKAPSVPEVSASPVPPRATVEPAGVQVSEDDKRLRVESDNRRLRKHKGLLVFLIAFWIPWAPASVLVTCAIFHPPIRIVSVVFFTTFSVLAWAVTLGIPYFILQRYWIERIEISRETFTHVRTGFLAGKPKVFPLDGIYEFGFSAKNPTISLIISYGRPNRRRRYSFGDWLVPEVKQQIFQALEDFAARKQIPLHVVKYGP
jgi:hypothetical protein